ncbi:MAG TPA: hypothetical protein VGJ93_11420 [Desulfuromonadaceae bacterium]|jgi:hypothetical protein
MSLPQLSPTAVISNPGQINPLAHVANNVSAAAAGSMAQQKTARQKSDSVTISREALEKAAQVEGHDPEAKETLTHEAAGKTTAK